MKTSELRRGNIIYNVKSEFDKRMVIVSGITSIMIACKQIVAEHKFFEPIPLTEEWLLKFGFKQDSDLKKSLVLFGIWFNRENMESTYLSTKLPKINYVHQLQNLYFALTEKELTIIN